jgi:hypothetical protein
MVLTDEDPLKVVDVLKLDLNDALQFLSYRVDKNNREREQMKNPK